MVSDAPVLSKDSSELEQLKEEYKARVNNTHTQDETDSEWARYLRLKYAIDQTPDIYQPIQRLPRYNGALNIYRYMDGRLTVREWYAVIRSDTADAYAQSLIDNGLAQVEFDATYEEIAKRPILEGLKEFDRLKLLDIRSGIGLAQTCTACSTLWLQFADALHARYDLPTMQALDSQRKLQVESNEERAVLDANDFDGFVLTPEEIIEYEDRTKAVIVEGTGGRG